MPALREALAQVGLTPGITRSNLEELFLTRVREAGLPPPELNATIDLGAMTIEADAVWRERRLIVELDGWQAHRTRDAFERDRERDRAAVLAGWTTLRVTSRSLAAGLALPLDA